MLFWKRGDFDIVCSKHINGSLTNTQFIILGKRQSEQPDNNGGAAYVIVGWRGLQQQQQQKWYLKGGWPKSVYNMWEKIIRTFYYTDWHAMKLYEPDPELPTTESQ